MVIMIRLLMRVLIILHKWIKICFSDIKLIITPDLSNGNTKNLFKINSSNNKSIDVLSKPINLYDTPLDSLDNLNKPC